jgi:hypothetical protein
MTRLSRINTVEQMPFPIKCPSALTVARLEATLEEWFGSSVVLTSSGRGALMLAFSHLGLNRYRDRIAMTPMISACVLDAVIRHAFPVDAGRNADANATLVYHQYGFLQTIKPPGPVVEDICHAFYAGPTTGHRIWLGELAVFSLPKFFATSSVVGGLVVHDRRQAEVIRARRDAEPERSIQQQDDESRIYYDRGDRSRFAVSGMHLSRLMNRRISDRELGGVPKDVSEIARRGQHRREIVAAYCDAVGEQACPRGWHEVMQEHLPYLFPVSGDDARLLDARTRLHEIDVEAEVYSIDVARNMNFPKYVKMLLLPCHDTIPPKIFAEILSILTSFKTCSSMI